MKNWIIGLYLLAFVMLIFGCVTAPATNVQQEEQKEAVISDLLAIHLHSPPALSTENFEQFLLQVHLRNGIVASYTITGSPSNIPTQIQVSPENFSNFREAVIRYLEWDSVATDNNVEQFTRDIPFSVTSSSVNSLARRRYRLENGELNIQFRFSWDPSRVNAKGRLLIESNFVILTELTLDRIKDRASYRFYTMMDRDAAVRFLENTTDEFIQEALQRKREEERQRQLQEEELDELFY